ncbi:MAG: CNNM domain-containing protein [Rhodobacteraceae bacterium]|nr:CNNM domain-containing protein [Paracoccaceae bacterium]
MANLDAAFWITVVVIFLLICASAFFSGSETALTSASRGKLRTRADRGNASAARALRLTANKERLLAAILLGNNLVNILATALATSLLSRMFGDSGVAIATLVMTVLILVFAEILPKSYAVAAPESAATRVSPVMGVFVWLFSPVVAMLQWVIDRLLASAGFTPPKGESIRDIQDDIAGQISLGIPSGMFNRQDQERILGALDMNTRSVEEVMLHRSEIKMLDADLSIRQAIASCIDSSYSRLPVYRSERENIVKVAHVKDLCRLYLRQTESDTDTAAEDDSTGWTEHLGDPYFVPETTTLSAQLRAFLQSHTHFALVVDEYGSLQGLVTLEDILEEIVGEIEDEHDLEDDPPLVEEADGSVTVDGSISIRDLNRRMNWEIPDDRANSVAGTVITEVRYIPVKGEKFSLFGFEIEVVERVRNRITRLTIRKLH